MQGGGREGCQRSATTAPVRHCSHPPLLPAATAPIRHCSHQPLLPAATAPIRHCSHPPLLPAATALIRHCSQLPPLPAATAPIRHCSDLPCAGCCLQPHGSGSEALRVQAVRPEAPTALQNRPKSILQNGLDGREPQADQFQPCHRPGCRLLSWASAQSCHGLQPTSSTSRARGHRNPTGASASPFSFHNTGFSSAPRRPLSLLLLFAVRNHPVSLQ